MRGSISLCLACVLASTVATAQDVRLSDPPRHIATNATNAAVAQTPGPRNPRDPNEYVPASPGLLFFALFALLVMVACAALAFTFLALLFGITGLLLVAGIISMSLCVGVLRKSVAGGFRTLFLQAGGAIGALGGVVAMLLLGSMGRLSWDSDWRWLIGIATGAMIGIVLAVGFNKIWTEIAKMIARKYEARRPSSSPAGPRI